ncbi:MAG TPA: PxKF domain-containing protein, partial [Longimicrobiales bacterium]|nr:PxKF domain-containing protein [Longimicrobiales bacterium]
NVPADLRDATPPVITPTITGTLGNDGWYTSDVTVTWTVTDEESAVTIEEGCEAATITADTDGVTLTCTATSAGGTASETVTIKRDATPPAIALAGRSPAANAAGWNNGDVTLTWTCTDEGSGPLSGTVSETVTGEGANLSVTGTCEDRAGNTASDTQGGINIDRTPPTLDPVVMPTPVLLNGAASASPNAADALSGVESASCESVETGSVGPHTVRCTATDRAGNTATAEAGYLVTYAFEGFFAPVSNDAPNTVKAGQNVPLKWRLLDANGTPVTNLGGVRVTVTDLACSLGATADLAEESAPGNSGLQNKGKGEYHFNWKTPKEYAKSCKMLELDLGEGMMRTAVFHFEK